ncbi:hypothetical protein [Lysobacter sp. CA196]|uniref:hypothetical protein n=1 Tax=Lysobacter sp. CA196 TaxID=3455606 RepID=UPI003F8D2C84
MGNAKLLLSAVLATSFFVTACAQKADGEKAADTKPAQAKTSALSLFALNVGNSQQTDGSVLPSTLFLPDDKLIASINTKGKATSVPVTATLTAMTDGRVLDEVAKSITTSVDATSNFEFSRQAPAWAIGRYLIVVSIDGKKVGQQEIEVVQSLPEGARP